MELLKPAVTSILLLTFLSFTMFWYDPSGLNSAVLYLQGSAISQREIASIQNKSTKTATTSKYLFRYSYNGSQGLQFRMSQKRWEKHRIKSFVNVSDITAEDVGIVIGISRNHFEESMDAIASVQHYRPNNTIYLYDVEPGRLLKHQRNKLKTLCNVEYRQLNFDLYPPHIRELHTCAFKILVVKDILKDHKGVFWMDASIRLKTADLAINLNDDNQTEDFQMHLHTGHSIYAATHPHMYEYIPSDMEKLKVREMYGGGSFIVYRTHRMWHHILRWMVLCSLERACIAPPGASFRCRFRKDRYSRYAGCHRHDQSLMNILLVNWGNPDKVIFGKDDYSDTHREPTNQFIRKTCKVRPIL